jgi:RNA polymerase sigma-70 factor (ECF subfamily)
MPEAHVQPAPNPTGPLPEGLVWEDVYRAHFKPVWKLLARLGTPKNELEDLAHEVFLTAFRREDAYDPARPLRPWLFGIASRLASDHRQRAFVQREDVTDEVPERAATISGPVAEKAVERRQAQSLLTEVLASLDGEKRAVFVMHELEGMTVPDIAKVVDVPVATAYSRLRLARDQFEAAVQRVRARVSHESAR